MTRKIYWLAVFLLLATACVSSQPSPRTQAEENYRDARPSDPAKNGERMELSSRIAAIASRVRAIDTQINTQREVIDRWRAMPEVPSGPALTQDAKYRIGQLQKEKDALLREQTTAIEKLRDLQVNP